MKEKLDAAREALKSAASDSQGILGEALRAAEHGIREEVDTIEARIRENPMGALLIAAGAGSLLDLALARKH